MFYFGEVKYHVDESDGYVEVKVWRTGSDLSNTGTVTIRSRKAEPVSAEGTSSQLWSQSFAGDLLEMIELTIRNI